MMSIPTQTCHARQTLSLQGCLKAVISLTKHVVSMWRFKPKPTGAVQ